MDVRLLLIDPQYDFCEKGDSVKPQGSLYVPGAEEDCKRLRLMIERKGDVINKIYSTYDSHYQYQIFFPSFWLNSEGNHPDPFTEITHDDVMGGTYRPVNPNMFDWCNQYTKTLKDGGRYPLFIWPYHTLIGTIGWTLHDEIREAIFGWENMKAGRRHNAVVKGDCFKTEHYSAVKAEVPVPQDPSTGVNMNGLIKPLEDGDIIAVGGQARSHCVANTVRDLMAHFNNPEYIKKIYLLEDGMSDVTGFESLGDAFFDDFLKAGGNITTTDKFLE